jgi:hypothetical protein
MAYQHAGRRRILAQRRKAVIPDSDRHLYR